ncbi:tetratricopeptide repeat protein [Psychrobacter piscatorii]|nr:tetratricopeptide repeat protein [Psychrobacter piscatorii]
MNIDDMESLDEETRKEIEELRRITPEKHGNAFFAQAQFNLGATFIKNGNIEEALEAFSNIQHLHSPKLYAAAQYHIGEIIESNGDIESALSIWRNINHSDNPEIYAAAQSYIGFVLFEKNDIEEALLVWGNITHADAPEQYVQAQFNIGICLSEKLNKEEALLAWSNITRLDDPELYAQAQYNIGSNLLERKHVEGALLSWHNIEKKDNSEAYAKAQLRIGNTLTEQGDYQGGLLAWCNVERLDDLEAYAKAQFKIASFLISFEYKQAAIKELQLIELMDDAEAYAKAQFNIGILLGKNSDIKGAVKAFRNIKYEYDSSAYGNAQYRIARILISNNDLTDYTSAKTCFELAREVFSYEARSYIRILELLEVPETKSFGLSLLDLLNIVLDIVDILTLNFSKYADEEKPFERKLAHYTSTYTSNLLLGNDKNNTRPSSFRLNTINNVNDPSEGQLLIRKLKDVKDNSFVPLAFDKKFHAFISCFTFNHDSLNQFRLYGKQDNKEASGMSLVFKKDFFQSKNLIGGISYLSIDNTLKITEAISNINVKESHDIQGQKIKNENDDQELVRRSVMRCVYLDPTSDYFHLAQRNRLTFFREFGDNIVIKNGTKQSQAEYEWGVYQEYIKIITEKFEVAYQILKTTYKEVETEINNVRFTLGSLKQKELAILVDEILLPLKYLIKHSAFREEQECRMIYITSIDRPEVTMEYGSFLYVEYEPSVKDHLDKIYIAPAALQHKRYFDNILKNVDVPVEVSGNVFR